MLRLKTSLVQLSIFASFTACTWGKSKSATSFITIIQPPPQTACLSLQGNGYLFTSLVGSAIALLENNIEPKVVSGNSAGAIVAPMIRAVLTNPSVAKKSELSTPRKAALVLSGSIDVLNSLVFPVKPNLLNTSALETAFQAALFQKLIGDFSNGLFHTDVPLAYGLMSIEFFQKTDFSDVVNEFDLKKRTQRITELWIKHTNSLELSLSEFALAVLKTPSNKNEIERVLEIRSRYYQIFSGLSGRDFLLNSSTQLQGIDETFSRFRTLASSFNNETIEKEFARFAEVLFNVPVLGTNANFLYRKVLLPDPLRMRLILTDLSRLSKPQSLPDGTLLHGSIRELSKLEIEKVGYEYLYHIYFPSSDIGNELLTKRNALTDQESFLALWPGNGVVIPKDRLLVDRSFNTRDAIGLTMAEPVAFSRKSYTLDSSVYSENGLNQNKKFIGYGGWFDLISLRTLSQLETCQNADFMVFAGLPKVDDLKLFVLKGVFDDSATQPDKNFEIIQNRFVKYHEDSKTIRGKQGSIALDFDWNNFTSTRDQLNFVQNHRGLLMLLSYVDAAKKIRDSGLSKARLPVGSAFGNLIDDGSFKNISSIDDLRALSARVFLTNRPL